MRRVVLGLLLCACGAGAARFVAAPGPFEPGPARWRLADRDGSRLVDLDDELWVVGVRTAGFPVRVVAARDGATWVLRARRGGPLSPARLERMDARGDVRVAVELPPALDLAVDVDAALVLTFDATPPDPGRPRRLVRVEADGERRELARVADASCVASVDGRALCGGDDGFLVLLDRDGVELARRRLDGQLGDVEPAPGGGFCALDVARGRVLRLEPDLSSRWEAAAGLAALHLAPVPGAERVWVVDVNQPYARRLGVGGAVEVRAGPLPPSGLDRAAATADGGCVLVAPGSVLQLDANGALVRSQGGFDFLVDVCAVAP